MTKLISKYLNIDNTKLYAMLIEPEKGELGLYVQLEKMGHIGRLLNIMLISMINSDVKHFYARRKY